MLTHDDFYATATRTGLVRQPIEYAVALLAATGTRSEQALLLHVMADAGQRPLYPPDVSGWKPNGYWVNASALGARQQLAQWCVARLTGAGSTWSGSSGYIDLPFGRLTRQWVEDARRSNAEVVDRILNFSGLVDRAGRNGADAPISADTRRRIIAHLDDRRVERSMRLDALLLALTAPSAHVA